MKILCVGGHFDDDNGRRSSIIDTIGQGADKLVNGGNYTVLESLIDEIKAFDVIYWFADVPNDKPKLVERIKAIHPKSVLVTSKRNYGGEYPIQQLVQRMLKTHSNLLVEFTGATRVINGANLDTKYAARVLDPLGNSFGTWTLDMNEISDILRDRIVQLNSFTRVASYEWPTGITIPCKADDEFMDIIHQHAAKFHQLIYGEVPIDRFLGNASFRCTKGFPSFKSGELIYVTRRNVNKATLDADSFVPVFPHDSDDHCPYIIYQGKHKPSVDTPVQVMLYNRYKRAKYMMHSHVYVKLTDDVPVYVGMNSHNRLIPCGALEEYDKIIDLVPDRDACNFAVNLRGHGFIVIADNLDFMQSIQYVERDVPEVHMEW